MLAAVTLSSSSDFLVINSTHFYITSSFSSPPLYKQGMAAKLCHQAIGTFQPEPLLKNSKKHQNLQNSIRLIAKDFSSCNSLSRRVDRRNCCIIRSSASQTSVVDPVLSPSRSTTSDSSKKSNEAALILIRHGESLWNEKNLFTGCVDVPLSKKGIDEAIEAGKRISSIPVDVIFTSALIRAQMTAMLAMTQHRRRKVPIIIHNESEQARAWSQIFSEETKKQSIPVIAAWQLNERMYGELQGLNKQETADRYGKEQVHEWRRSYDTPPPNGESLEMCAERAVAYFREQIEPQLSSGKNVMIAAHGNSLRSIIMYLDKLTSQEVISLELSTGIPMLYIFKEGRFIRRGSPIGPTEAGVYAYTRTLTALIRDHSVWLFTDKNWMTCTRNTGLLQGMRSALSAGSR
ncbi:2,3-bisphosphoglycerate-dependent phosphoglycerate mutase 1-like isoform X2 [Prosopis cineraria]|uniref:2,3-bisphosphoglycerate-dependent phosphoglycerate mutase 1-like isoform X2 n=1 Tax=Prosopis cineraria TaxID=364024 RepID=UPI0024103D54|nr:2,3-bisphosphoglycerate-dependent phosphoglycerate mutase 1-like isoform X2 [Prosopis cineraria]